VTARYAAQLYRFIGFRGAVGVATGGEAMMVVPHEMAFPGIYTNEVRVLHHRHGVAYAPTAQLDLIQRSDSTS
jgi:hypothetical protein